MLKPLGPTRTAKHRATHMTQHSQQLVAKLHMPPPHRLQLVPQHRFLQPIAKVQVQVISSCDA